jgi:hypothetical protein
MTQSDLQNNMSCPWPCPKPPGLQRNPPMRHLQVTVPPGCVEGQHISITTDTGRPLTVQIPAGLFPGQSFFCLEGSEVGPSAAPQPMPTQAMSGQQMPGAPCIRPHVPSHVLHGADCVLLIAF